MNAGKVPDVGSPVAAWEAPAANGSARPQRADARRNRALIIEAAESVLAEKGLTAPVDDIAREAGVGVGTLYRHFPTKEALLQAILNARVERMVADAQARASADDPVAAFFGFLAGMAEQSRSKKAFADALIDAGIKMAAGSSGAGQELTRAVGVLLHRAQRTGAVRTDVRVAEVLGLLSATCLAAERGRWAADVRTRTLALLFDSLRT